jgi:two-component system chemotaxis sensor kinase CheA
MKPQKIRRTLKKRISRTIYLASGISIMLFGLAVLVGFTFLLKPISSFASNFIISSVVREMNSESFLRQYELTSLSQFDSTQPYASDWVRSMDNLTKLETYIPLPDKKPLDGQQTKEINKFIMFNQDFNFIELHIELNGKIIYTNESQLMKMDESQIMRHLISFYTAENTAPLVDKSGVEIGRVRAMVAPQFTVALFGAFVGMFLMLVFISLLISRFIGKLISIPVLNPLDQLITRMREISQESTAMDSKIELKRPLREIESLAEATNVIMYKMKDFSEKLQQQKDVLEDQNEELEAQNEELTTSKQLLQSAQHQLIRSGKSIRNLLDNAGQGFLTFGTDLKVDPDYSLECSSIFGREIGGVSFAELLGEGDEEQQRFLENLLQKLFTEPDKQKRSIYFPLLTDEIVINYRNIRLDYKMIQSTEDASAESIMVILTDITEKRELQSQMEHERNILKMVVKVIVNYGDFMDCVRNARVFYEFELPELLRSEDSVKTKLLSLYRDTHTYKGNFAQFGLVKVVERLHDAETKLSQLIRRADELTQEELAACIADLHIEDWLTDDMAVLQSVLGDSFFNQEDLLMIDKTKIMEIERKMLAVLSPNECKLLLPDLRKLRYKPFRELFKTYPEYVNGLAERMEKFIHPITITGGDFAADTETYYDFSRSLIHVFRNMIDHAVEPVDVRAEAGKDEAAAISCHIELNGGGIMMELSDDGTGIDAAAIRKRLADKGICTREAAEQLTDQEAISFIFHDEFSTKDHVSDISGRGIGLSSVKAEVEKLGGSIEVFTEVGKGTMMRFQLPYEELTSEQLITYPETLNPSIETTRHYLEQFAGLPLRADDSFERYAADKLTLKTVTAFVGMKGAVEGFFVMTVDEPLSREMVRGIVIDQMDPEEEEKLVEDTLAETANIVLGNSLKIFGPLSEYMIMEPPITIYTEGASVKYADSDIWTSTFEGNHGSMQISFVIMKRG